MADAETTRLPLAGVRVLDATNTYAGPTCARVLGDLGAEVIHLEAMQRWETVRLIIMPDNDAPEAYWNAGAYFQKRNLGKQGITLDLTRADGVAALKRLLATCDVMLESFAPRVMRGFGLDFEAVRAVRPDIVYCSLSGYGQTGPYRDWIAYGMGLEPASGISQTTGYAGGPPQRSGISLTDPLTGLAAAAAVLISLYYRRRSGVGQYIDLSEQEAALPLVAGALLDRQMNGREPVRRGNRSWFAAPQGVYPCAGDDEWIAISCHDDAEWQRLCDATGHQDWQRDPRFADLIARHTHHDALDEAIALWTSAHAKMDAMRRLQQFDVRAGAVLHGKDLLLNDHLHARGFFERIDHPIAGTHPFPRQLPVHFSTIASGARGPAPLLGEHNDEVLGGLAGLSPEELAELRAANVVGERPEPAQPRDLVASTITWPLDVLIEVGAIKQVDRDYRAQLGLE